MTGRYTCTVNRREEIELIKAAIELNKRNLIKSTSKYAVTKFALLNIVEGLKKLSDINGKTEKPGSEM